MEMLRKQWIQPFRVPRADGAVFDIRRTEMIVVGWSIAHLYCPPEGMPLPAFERRAGAALLHFPRRKPRAMSAA